MIQKLLSLSNEISAKLGFARLSSKTDEQRRKELFDKEKSRLSTYVDETEVHYTKDLHISLDNTPALYLNCTNKSSYEKTISILNTDVENLKSEIKYYLQSKETEFSEEIQKSLRHLIRFLELLQNRIDVLKDVNDSSFFSTSDYREYARRIFTELISTYIVSRCMQQIYDVYRLNEKKKDYEEVATYFHSFLQKQGVFTKSFNIYDEIDFELFIPNGKKMVKDATLNGRIAEIYMLPYFFNDPNYNGYALINEGSCGVFSTH